MDPVPGEDVRAGGSRGSCGTEEGALVVQKKGALVMQKKEILVVQKIHVSYLNNILKLK